jgi:hypothetical protein
MSEGVEPAASLGIPSYSAPLKGKAIDQAPVSLVGI